MPSDNRNDDLIDAKIFVRKIQKRALISGSVFGILLALIWTQNAGYGYISGMAVGMINFQLMSVDSYHMIGKNPQKARKFIIGRYFLRSVIMFGFIALIATRTDFNIVTALIGLFHVKFILIGDQILQATTLSEKTS